jgi:ABC-type oligopeptide transport system substrate-binding subunit
MEKTIMKNSTKPIFLVAITLLIAISACSPTASTVPTQPVVTNTFQPISSPQPTNTFEPTLTATPLPGEVVIPLESLQFGFPWQPVDRSQLPMVVYYGFNVAQPPFDVPEVRQAFAAALDTEALTAIYTLGSFFINEIATRTVIPAQTLIRDVSGEIGLPYDPVLAKQLLASAGYADPASFPETTLLIVYLTGADYPGILVNAANEAIRMWQENLGVKVKIEVVALHGGDPQEQRNQILSGKYQIFEHGVWTGENDPHDLFSSMFTPDGSNNMTGFNQDRVTLLINNAYMTESDPTRRLPIYLELERILSEEELPIIPIFHCTVDASGW